MLQEDTPLGEGEEEPELDYSVELIMIGIDPDLLYAALLMHDLPEITTEDLEEMYGYLDEDDEEYG